MTFILQVRECRQTMMQYHRFHNLHPKTFDSGKAQVGTHAYFSSTCLLRWWCFIDRRCRKPHCTFTERFFYCPLITKKRNHNPNSRIPEHIHLYSHRRAKAPVKVTRLLSDMDEWNGQRCDKCLSQQAFLTFYPSSHCPPILPSLFASIRWPICPFQRAQMWISQWCGCRCWCLRARRILVRTC